MIRPGNSPQPTPGAAFKGLLDGLLPGGKRHDSKAIWHSCVSVGGSVQGEQLQGQLG
jgi:hypothetical protein